jgi:hypothetical protein
MITLNPTNGWLGRLRLGLLRLGRLEPGRALGGAVTVSVGVVALVGGCGTAPAPGASRAAPSGAASGTSSAAAVAGPAGKHTPVPTVSGGQVAAGEPACAGWPTGTSSRRLPALFVPVAVEQCVSGVQDVPGKGTWETATLERATTGLAPLLNALRAPGQVRSPSMICTDVLTARPELMLISGSGERVVPQIPVTGCGIVRSAVLAALATLPWQPVSVRLVEQVTSGSAAPDSMNPAGTGAANGGIHGVTPGG